MFSDDNEQRIEYGVNAPWGQRSDEKDPGSLLILFPISGWIILALSSLWLNMASESLCCFCWCLSVRTRLGGLDATKLRIPPS